MNWDYLYFWRQSERRESEASHLTRVAEPPRDGTTENVCEFAALEDLEASDKNGAPAR
jgi:hypothetical protein